MKKKAKQLKHKDIAPLREKLILKQGNKCAVCGASPIVKPCLDHEHRKRLKGSGKVRGIICFLCNIFVGKVENNAPRNKIPLSVLPSRLRQIADYLERPHLPLLHPSEAPKRKKLKKSSYKKLVVLLKQQGYKKKIPDYPKSGKVVNSLKKLYKLVKLTPAFYK